MWNRASRQCCASLRPEAPLAPLQRLPEGFQAHVAAEEIPDQHIGIARTARLQHFPAVVPRHLGVANARSLEAREQVQRDRLGPDVGVVDRRVAIQVPEVGVLVRTGQRWKRRIGGAQALARPGQVEIRLAVVEVQRDGRVIWTARMASRNGGSARRWSDTPAMNLIGKRAHDTISSSSKLSVTGVRYSPAAVDSTRISN